MADLLGRRGTWVSGPSRSTADRTTGCAVGHPRPVARPGVRREALGAGGGLGAGLELLGQAEGDPGRGPLLSGGGRIVGHRHVGGLVRRRDADDEADVPAPQSDVDGAGSQLRGQLLGRGRQRTQQGQPERRLERRGEPLGERPRFVTTDLGGRHQLPAELVDVGGEVHDDTVTSL